VILLLCPEEKTNILVDMFLYLGQVIPLYFQLQKNSVGMW
jgi:hypothetical protein